MNDLLGKTVSVDVKQGIAVVKIDIPGAKVNSDCISKILFINF